MLGNNLLKFLDAVLDFLPSFIEGENGHILFVMAPVVRAKLDVVNEVVFDGTLQPDEFGDFHEVLYRYDSMLDRARRAISCWSVVGRRYGLNKDVRVMVSKSLWEQPWDWSATPEEQEPEMANE
jgi:hypothetical protein